MRTSAVVAILLVGLGLGGCRKKSAPEFYRLESRATILADRDGDEGRLSDEMGEIITELQAIPADRLEGPRARALAEALVAERARLLQERAPARAAEVDARATEFVPSLALAAEPRDAEAADAGLAPDAGPGRPWLNMALAEFRARFGVCMEASGELDVPGQGRLRAWEVLRTPTCMVRYSLDEDTRHFFLFREDRLALERTEQRLRFDAGPPPPPPPTPTPAPAPYVMGMPVPGAFTPDAQ